MNCTADVKADGCDLYVGTQVQQAAQSGRGRGRGPRAGTGQGLHTTLLGGGFGRRLEVDFIPAAVDGLEGGRRTGEADLDPRR